jgi:hypothetical protein
MKEIIELLQSHTWLVNDEIIEIAKGKYEYPSTLKGWGEKIKRKIKIK